MCTHMSLQGPIMRVWAATSMCEQITQVWEQVRVWMSMARCMQEYAIVHAQYQAL